MRTVAAQQIKRNLLKRSAQEKTRQEVGLVEDSGSARQNLAEVLPLESAGIDCEDLTKCLIGEEELSIAREDEATARKRVERIAIET
jgi:uncharacterized membrane protein